MSTTLTKITIAHLSKSSEVADVTRALRSIAGANRLTVRLLDGGGGIVSILSNHVLSETDLTAAVASAGFEVDKIDSQDDALAKQMKDQAPARQASRNLSLANLEP
ncbi:MAG: hypothetical protein LBB58_07275 [Cellulomonadaceae bacterium]|jgi:hypothetical protein|nr:hypothetical protein [Cellulomonadaceae bacterium]